MNAYAWSLMIATFLLALMAGFLFAFAIVVMPGITKLKDRDFLRSFQAMDRVIQNGQPFFVFVWLGSTIALIVTAVLSAVYHQGLDRAILGTAAAAHVLLVQLPTMTINIPLNNKVQLLDVDTLDDVTANQARRDFESRWNLWNHIRTIASCVILAALLWLR